MAKPTPEQIDEAVNIQLARHEFWEYCLYRNEEFFTKRFFLKPVADALQYLFEQYIAGNPKRISISMPPRAGKSYIVTLFCAWFLGKLPQLCVMRNSCTATLYQKMSRQVRNEIKSPEYRTVFPHIRLSADNQALDGWSLETSINGAYFGGGVDTNIIGNGANLAINDDLYPSLAAALSPGNNEKVLEWKDGTADSRKELNCSEIYIGTRWRKGDVIGVAIEKGLIDLEVTIPALIYDDEHPEGRSFCEYVKSTDEYQLIKKNIAPAIWDAEYMQNPKSREGLMFPLDGLNFYNPATVDVDKLSEYRVGYCDPADEGGDSLSFPAGYLVDQMIYITDVIFNTKGTDINEPSSVEFIINHGLNDVQMEGNSAWKLFRKNVKRICENRGCIAAIRSINNSVNKHTRILEASAFIRNYFVFRLDWETYSEDYRKFMNNLTEYMEIQSGKTKNEHEDAPDSCAGMARMLRTQFPRRWDAKKVE